MKKSLVMLGVLAGLMGSANAAEWGYHGAHGPEHWGDVSALCQQGKNQSPINIEHVLEADLAKLDINYQGRVTELVNNGHTLQAVVGGDNRVVVDGQTFDLQQFHFHTPSENLIKGQQFAVEAHFVNSDQQGNLAVIAVMFDLGSELNKPLASLLQQVPKTGESVKLDSGLDVRKLLPDFDGYYRFNGSLTTPPCSEGVRWLVLNEPLSVNQHQRDVLNQAMGDNNRPTQPINARQVLGND